MPLLSGLSPADQLEIAWQQSQTDLAERLGVEVFVAEDTGHFIAAENPELVVSILLGVIVEVK